MYAIVVTGGKQYRVEPGATLYLESLDTPVGETVTLGQVLLVGGGDDAPRLGSPFVDKAAVVGTVVEHGRAAKVRVFKYKRRKHYRRTRGHRQAYTAVRIDTIQG